MGGAMRTNARASLKEHLAASIANVSPWKCRALSQKGMTLVEALVASVIGVVLAGIIIIIYSMFNRQVKENNAYLIMQMQYENLSEQIAFNTRRAHVILDGTVIYNDSTDTMGSTLTNVKFYNATGTVIGGVGIFGDTVKELDNGATWIPFKTGNGIVVVKPGSSFLVPGGKNSISLNLTLKYNDRDTTYYLQPRKDEFLCRNSKL
jgi:type II secretory pathway pseudopilin PulG